MIDSHCHLDHEPLLENLTEIIINSKKIGITKLLTICSALNSFQKIKEIIQKDNSNTQLSVAFTYLFNSFEILITEFEDVLWLITENLSAIILKDVIEIWGELVLLAIFASHFIYSSS